jgi:CHAT domain-containing protein/tetratricopeptide (TPR) repeat protein
MRAPFSHGASRAALLALLLALPLAAPVRAVAQRSADPGFPAEMLRASALRDSGEYLRADSAVRPAIAALEQAWGQDGPWVAAALLVHADILYQLARYPAADSAAARAVAIRERTLPADDPALAEALSTSGQFRAAVEEYDSASALLRRARSIQEARLGPDHPDAALTLHRQALLHLWRGEMEPAEPLLRQALAAYRAHPGEREEELAWLTTNVGILLRRRGRPAEGMALLRESFTIRQRVTPPGHPRLASAALSLGGAYEEDANYAGADSLYARALEIYRQRMGDRSSQAAQVLGMIGGLRWLQGNLEAADSLRTLAVEILLPLVGEDDAGLAVERANLAMVKHERGWLGSAEELLRRALAVLEPRRGADHPEVAGVASALATVLQERGDLPQAAALRWRVLQTYERQYGPESPAVAAALNNLAVLYGTMNDEAAAEPLLRRALAIQESTLGPGHPDVASALMNLAAGQTAMGRHAQADSLLTRAIRIVDAGSAAPADRAAVRASYGTALVRAGDFERGSAVQEEALALFEQAWGADHPDMAVPLRNLAVTYLGSQWPARAAPLLQRALAVQAAALGSESPAYARTVGVLAMAQQGMGRLDSALASYTRADDLLERHLAYVLTFGSEAQKQGLVAGTGNAASRLVSLHLGAMAGDSAAARAALTAVLRRKGRALDATAESLGALREQMGPNERALFDELAAVRGRWARWVTAGPGNEPPGVYRARVAGLADRAAQLEREIGARTAALGMRLRPVTLDAVQARVPAGAALVEIVVYEPSGLSPGAGGATPGSSPRYAAYVLHPAGAPRAVDLGPVAGVDSAVLRLRQALANPRRPDARERARELDARVLAPLRPLLDGATTLLVAPDGALNLVPFGALVGEDGRYLLQDVVVGYLTSGRDLLRLDGGTAPGGAPLIVAAPAYGQAPGGGRRWRPLDAARDEAALLATVLPGARVLTGADASEAALKAADGPALLHVATHGWFIPDAGAGADVTPPLLRAGLAFAGANAGGTGDGEDGVLTAMEAAGLDLRGTRLVVLSACETGLGDVRSNDGVYGLRRALLLAGAESQVMTLWRVDDRATRDVMVQYYEGLRDGRGRAEALRQVQLGMLAEGGRSHPYYWAAFVPAGDWRPLPDAPR